MKQNITAFIFSIIFAAGIGIVNNNEIVWLTVPWLLPIFIGIVLFKKKVNICTKVGFWYILVGALLNALLFIAAFQSNPHTYDGLFFLIIAMIVAIWILLISLIFYIISLFIASKK